VPVAAERRLITIGHSYVVAENRRLAHEMALAGRGRWHVTAIAPSSYRADLRPVDFEPLDGEATEVIQLGVRLDRVPHFMSYRGLRRVLSGGIDLVHCWEEPYVLAAAQIARTIPASSKLVMASFQNLRKSYPWPLSEFERESMRRAAGWIAFGHTVAETLGPHPGYVDKPHRVIPPGVDVERFRPDPAAGAAIRRRIGWAEDALVIGYLGRFAPQKGVTDLCAALDKMRTPWHALFVGGGSLQGDLEQFALAHPGRVHIATDVRHSDVPGWLNAMTMLCAPSRTTTEWREQFGRMLIEAMACGVPVLASDTGEMPVVVRDAGRVLPEGDPATWARSLDAYLEDPATRELMAKRGIERARTFFAWPIVARRHLEFFDALLEGRSQP
jgi:glycosyltransferase involved in cell wall biosynthesis